MSATVDDGVRVQEIAWPGTGADLAGVGMRDRSDGEQPAVGR